MTQFPRVRDVLNKLRHTGQLDHDVRLLVRDRASDTGTKEISGDQIRRIGKREFEAGLPEDQWDAYGHIAGLGAVTIPFYKVTVIWQRGERIWERP
ncbi:DUF504 domain-containing protein [Candidatus Woesearchaeota archaeon]|nr:DUF504 domain-containing protein [Candidatus Woesearchaeota archaeon]